ncbi:MAG: hypothetical protein CMJ72_12435 [Planctomycetaceae bacterium]|nr:hypothetical protein [Planctomycetaceae bacterium]HCK42347.1 hypothetical protein [Planctomycetaceae bacterium]
MHLAKILAVALVLVFVAQWLWRRWRAAQQQAQRQLAMLKYFELGDSLQKEFIKAAAATGKPRGLRWKQCDLQAAPLFAIDRANGELFALVGATISFEAIPGGDMEDVEAVGNLRSATAIFAHRQGRWTTDGRTVFNLEPPQALEHFRESLQKVEACARELAGAG